MLSWRRGKDIYSSAEDEGGRWSIRLLGGWEKGVTRMSRGRERENEREPYTSRTNKDQGDGDDKVPLVDLSIAQVFMHARQKSGLTQKELSERTGIAQGNISKLERGNANPSLKTMLRLAAGMNMTLKIDFLEKTPEKREEMGPDLEEDEDFEDNDSDFED